MANKGFLRIFLTYNIIVTIKKLRDTSIVLSHVLPWDLVAYSELFLFVFPFTLLSGSNICGDPIYKFIKIMEVVILINLNCKCLV